MLIPPSQPPPLPEGQLPWRFRIARAAILIGSPLILFLVGFLAWPEARVHGNIPGPDQETASQALEVEKNALSLTGSLTPSPTSSPTALDPNPPAPLFQSSLGQGTLILTMGEGGYSHLFAYQPLTLPLTRLTEGAWDDITPALSPDGNQLAFASNRAGQWDIYLLDLNSGAITRWTDTPEFDSSPTWSPDGQYLAYETYLRDLEIVIQPISGDRAVIPLSNDPAADFAPTWSPQGRQVAFVSTRSGEPEIWLADLDKVESERFTNLSQTPDAVEAHPAWSPDGRSLAWATTQDGLHNLQIWDGNGELRYVGSGDWPTWSPDGAVLFTTLSGPDQTLVTAYQAREHLLALPPLALPGPVFGQAWTRASLPPSLLDSLSAVSSLSQPELWRAALTVLPEVPTGRQHLVPLEDVQAPYPQLHDLVDESFSALRARVAAEAGWDFLATLENAFVPLTAPLSPGLGEDWLYTGRAFAFTPLAIDAGWVAVVPEQFGARTYWRVYLRARFQDGSQGAPLHDQAWDFNARYGGDPFLYEHGGAFHQEILRGYWVDFTEMAAAYKWDRLPALPTWRSAYPAARFNEFVFQDGQSWREAMLDLYPIEALVTPTAPAPTARLSPIAPPTIAPPLTQTTSPASGSAIPTEGP